MVFSVILCVLIAGGCASAPWIIEPAVLAEFGSTTLNLSLVGQKALFPAVEIIIQGKPFLVDVDTGAASATLYLSPQALAELEVNWTGKSCFFINLLGKPQFCREYRLRDIRLGDLVLPGRKL
jgi:hypothetical protein